MMSNIPWDTLKIPEDTSGVPSNARTFQYVLFNLSDGIYSRAKISTTLQ